MRTSVATLLAVLGIVPAVGAPAAVAQTQGSTYAVGPSDFAPSYTRPAERRRMGAPAAYDDGVRQSRRARVIDCSRFEAADACQDR